MKEKKSGNKGFAIVFGALILIGGTYGVIKYRHAQRHEETDDAQIVSTISPVIPRVAGYIQDVRVSDNQLVHRGDTLVILDNRDFQVQLAQAEAALASAQSNVDVAGAGVAVAQANIDASQTSIGTVDAQIESAKVDLWRASADFERYQNLIADHSITQQQYEQAMATKQVAEQHLAVLESQKQSAIRQVNAVSRQKSVSSGQALVAAATIKQREAEVEAARLDLSYTVITAAIDGQVGKVNLQAGQFLNAGQALFNIVPTHDKWVVANFKETQLTKMQVGQKVSIKVDAFPDSALEGTVTSFSPATGAIQSLLPPDNASGNFVKVVQRVPVRIDFDTAHQLAFIERMRTGMNVLVDVHLN
ncbi:HlyD family secretion protein [Parapedobacter koreensis]|nr:HlyD family secretion protein [Parapedobacter koreensis]